MAVPSERFGFHAPSEGQLRLAEGLKLSVPAGISRSGLSQLIDRELNARVRATVSKLDLQTGTQFCNKRNGVLYTVREVRLHKRDLLAYNEAVRRTVAIGLGSFEMFYEVIRQE